MANAPKPAVREQDSFDNQDAILLGVLTAIERNSTTSQRSISRELGVALGLANAYLKRSVRKGFIKIQQVPRRRYVYYLTPHGFAEKARLTGEYFSASFTFFRRAREQLSELMGVCQTNGWRRVVFAGISDLAEVGTICAHDFDLQIVGILDGSRAGERYCGLSVCASIEQFGPIDAVIVTALTSPEAVYQDIVAAIGAERVLVPTLLRLVMPKPTGDEKARRAAE